MPHSSTYVARNRGSATGGYRSDQMWGPREIAHTVGCYHLAVQCPIRRIAGPCDGFSCSDPFSCMPVPPCPKPESCEDLLKNMAAAEAALARSLDTEGERFRRIIESASDSDALLNANRAVIRTLDDVIGKEKELYRELQRIIELCGACEPKPKDAGVPGGHDPKDTRIPEKPDSMDAGIPGKPDPKAFPGYGF